MGPVKAAFLSWEAALVAVGWAGRHLKASICKARQPREAKFFIGGYPHFRIADPSLYVRVSEKNNATSCLSFGPPIGFAINGHVWGADLSIGNCAGGLIGCQSG
jgi:hypothetical protein